MKKIYLLLALGLAACTDEITVSSDTVGGRVPDGTIIELPINLTVADEEGLTRAICDDGTIRDIVDDTDGTTRGGIDDTGNGTTSLPKDVYVLQFLGTGDEAKLVSRDKIQDYQVVANRTIKFSASTEQHTIVAVANSGNDELDLPLETTTLGALKKKVKNIDEQRDLFSYTTTATGSFPTNTEYYVPMNGAIVVDGIQPSTTINIPLRRPISRIDLKLNVLNSLKLTIESIRLCNVPNGMHYYTSYAKLPSETEIESKEPTTLPLASFTTIDFGEPADLDKDETDATTTVYKARFYAPSNMRGVMTNTTNKPSHKVCIAPDKSTCIEVVATTKDADNRKQARIYTFYLGEDLVKDFNLRPNRSYTYEIDIKGVGDPDSDLRILDYGDVDFRTWPDANCYILNPPVVPGTTRRFKIPVRRVDQFWGYGDNKDKPKYEYNENYQLGSGTAWTADLIWADFVINPNTGVSNESTTQVTLTKVSGTGSTNNASNYIEVSVPYGTPAGNMLVGVMGQEGTILWSWHLWITDYNPYPALSYVIGKGANAYFVPGGKVYHSSSWDNVNQYQNALMLDREIGTLRNFEQGGNLHIWGVRGCLYYQYGRKDPFTKADKYKRDGTKLEHTTQDATAITTNNTIWYSVNNPYIQIIGNPWCRGLNDKSCKYNPTDDAESMKLTWNDPHVKIKEYLSPGHSEHSIFDPSPCRLYLPSKAGLTSRCSYYNLYAIEGNYQNIINVGIVDKGHTYWFYADCEGYITVPYIEDGRFHGYVDYRHKGICMPNISIMPRNGN